MKILNFILIIFFIIFQQASYVKADDFNSWVVNFKKREDRMIELFYLQERWFVKIVI